MVSIVDTTCKLCAVQNVQEQRFGSIHRHLPLRPKWLNVSPVCFHLEGGEELLIVLFNTILFLITITYTNI